ncbi:unnamed protein product [Protopolystoma xenopodis]|uniref:Uncharacterized protein n=1 Tax=Protopolystoma xenopodis TaxID=117903 RepID=A0A448WUZ6_9PLAT|nr:unnamed protein product [Protopolystoma xenopodis]
MIDNWKLQKYSPSDSPKLWEKQLTRRGGIRFHPILCLQVAGTELNKQLITFAKEVIAYRKAAAESRAKRAAEANQISSVSICSTSLTTLICVIDDDTELGQEATRILASIGRERVGPPHSRQQGQFDSSTSREEYEGEMGALIRDYLDFRKLILTIDPPSGPDDDLPSGSLPGLTCSGSGTSASAAQSGVVGQTSLVVNFPQQVMPMTTGSGQVITNPSAGVQMAQMMSMQALQQLQQQQQHLLVTGQYVPGQLGNRNSDDVILVGTSGGPLLQPTDQVSQLILPAGQAAAHMMQLRGQMVAPHQAALQQQQQQQLFYVQQQQHQQTQQRHGKYCSQLFLLVILEIGSKIGEIQKRHSWYPVVTLIQK